MIPRETRTIFIVLLALVSLLNTALWREVAVSAAIAVASFTAIFYMLTEGRP